MDAQPKESLPISIRQWTQFLLLLFAAAFGVYTFHFKEVAAPKSAPINITLDVQTRRAGAGNTRGRQNERLTAIELKVAAKNPSSRTVYLLRNIWYASASNIEARPDDDRLLDKEVTESVNSPEQMLERHSVMVNRTIVASGILFVDNLLRPGETISRTVVFHNPNELYDQVYFNILITTAAK
jgi:hypothetical protein